MPGLDNMGGSLQAGSLVLLWIFIAWPLWSFLFVSETYRILDMMPFIINCLSLTGKSYEGQSVDWRIWVLNLVAAGPLSVASMIVFRGSFDIPGLVIVGCACLTSIMGSLGSVNLSRKVTEAFDLRITLVKAIIAGVFFLMAAWGIAYLDVFLWSTFCAHILVGATGAYSSLMSLLYIPPKKSRKAYGIGSPLLWLSARALFSPGVPWFFLWSGLFLFGFLFLNLFQNRADFCTMCRNHWRGWHSLEQSSNALSLVLALMVSLLVSNGITKVVTVEPGNEEYLLANLSQQWEFFETLVRNCSEEVDVVSMRSSSIRAEFPVARTYTHYMYEETASVIAVTFLLLNSVACYLRRAFDKQSKQGHWQPVFFFVCGALVFFSQRGPDEMLGRVENRISTRWAADAIIAVAAAFIGGILTVLVSAFRVIHMIRGDRYHEMMVRENTLYAKLGLESRRFGGLVICVCLCALLGLSVYGATSKVDEPVVYQGPPRGRALEDLSSYELSNTSFCPGLDSFVNRVQAIQVTNPQIEHLGISSLMGIEYTVLCVLYGVAALFQAFSVWVPEADEVVLVMTTGAGILFTAALTFTVREVRSLETGGTLFEWLVLTVGLLQFVTTGLLLVYRLHLQPIDLPWKTEEEMIDAFDRSPLFHLVDYIVSTTRYHPKATDSREIFLELRALVVPSGCGPLELEPLETMG